MRCTRSRGAAEPSGLTIETCSPRPGERRRSVLTMNSNSIRFDLLFNADEYHRSGFCPWTFFAYPTSIADEHGLPPDHDACNFLACLQERGIDVAIWVNGIAENTTHFACRKDDIQRLNDVIQELEDSGEIEKGFCNLRTERLFAPPEKHRTRP